MFWMYKSLMAYHQVTAGEDKNQLDGDCDQVNELSSKLFRTNPTREWLIIGVYKIELKQSAVSWCGPA